VLLHKQVLYRNYKYISVLIISFGLQSCLFPPRAFEKSRHPKAPDYSKQEHWAALPSKEDKADLTIPNTGVIDKQSEAKADVFFIHPTTYRAGPIWNARLNMRMVNKRTDRLSMLYQASAFNGSCRVYAPRYRQASLVTYIEKKGNAPKVFGLAYQDVRQAFLYYLNNYNQGRPFIIAAHSQGTDHAIRLINEFIKKDSALYGRFIVAYLIGRPINNKSVTAIQPCDSAEQCKCYNAWNVVPWGDSLLFRARARSLVSVNPLTWKRDTAYAPHSLNLGGLPLNHKFIDVGVADAKVAANGLVWVHRPKYRSNRDYLYIESNSFHTVEYNLFYMNIRENVKQRVNAWFDASGK
jgi:hypothetical protein